MNTSSRGKRPVVKCFVVGDDTVRNGRLLRSLRGTFCEETAKVWHTWSEELLFDEKFVKVEMSLRDHIDASVFLIVFSIVNPGSFNTAKSKWNYKLRTEYPGIPRILVGMDAEIRQNSEAIQKLKENGIDIIPYEDGRETAKQLDCVRYFECHAGQSDEKSTLKTLLNKILEWGLYGFQKADPELVKRDQSKTMKKAEKAGKIAEKKRRAASEKKAKAKEKEVQKKQQLEEQLSGSRKGSGFVVSHPTVILTPELQKSPRGERQLQFSRTSSKDDWDISPSTITRVKEDKYFNSLARPNRRRTKALSQEGTESLKVGSVFEGRDKSRKSRLSDQTPGGSAPDLRRDAEKKKLSASASPSYASMSSLSSHRGSKLRSDPDSNSMAPGADVVSSDDSDKASSTEDDDDDDDEDSERLSSGPSTGEKEKEEAEESPDDFLEQSSRIKLALDMSPYSIPAWEELPANSLDMSDAWLIDTGAYGEVYRVKWRGDTVAVKMMRTTMGQNFKAIRSDFCGELKMMAMLRSPYLVQLLAACTLQEPLMIVTEFMELGNLRQFLSKTKAEGSRREGGGGSVAGGGGGKSFLTMEKILQLAMDVLKGLIHLHARHVIHRDLKPANILLYGPKRYPRAKIGDFGSARRLDATQMTGEIGTLAYMAPEVMRSAKKYDSKVDIFGFGMILYEMIYGSHPFSDKNLPSMILAYTSGEKIPFPQNTKCPEMLKELIEKCTSLLPSDRPTAEEALMELETLFSSLRKRKKEGKKNK